MPLGRMVTRSTGSAAGESAATSACPDSWTATLRFSESSRKFDVLALAEQDAVAGLGEVRGADARVRPSRTATIAASLTRLARSAPEKPGVARATASRSTSGPRCRPRACTARIARRSGAVGSGTTTCRSNRPGRSSAGSRVSGRLVAAMTTTPVEGSKPSISASSWLSVCSRSSLLAMPVAPALADRVDLVDEDDRRRPLARLGEQVAHPRGADADEQLDEARAGHGEERHRRLAGDGAGEQRLAGAGRAGHEHAPRRDGPGGGVLLVVAQEVDDLGDVALDALVAGDVGEGGGGAVGVDDLRLRPADTASPRARRGPPLRAARPM